jgi:hypothetical protein
MLQEMSKGWRLPGEPFSSTTEWINLSMLNNYGDLLSPAIEEAYAGLFNHSLERGLTLSSFSFILEAEAKRDHLERTCTAILCSFSSILSKETTVLAASVRIEGERLHEYSTVHYRYPTSHSR